MTIKSTLMSHMEESFLFRFDEQITESTDLFKVGIIDSHGYIRLMHYIQGTFDVKFSRSELLSNVITSVAGIVAVVEAKLVEKNGGERVCAEA
jgi:D-alanine--poly(phosphoribitol) ligase subunit 2